MAKKKALILVVDDDIRMVRMMKRMLELEGFIVTTASGGEQALKMFDKETPSLVLLDIMMPDMDGYTVCRRIREFSEVPIIMVTARGDDKEKVEGLDIGADDYVTKPFSASELAARVRRDVESNLMPGLSAALPAELELRSLRRTRRLITLQKWLFGFAIGFTALGLTSEFTWSDQVKEFHFLIRDHPLQFGICLLLGLACWVGHFSLRRKLRSATP